MTGVGFTYPGTQRQVLRDVNVRCNLNSRVAVLGVRNEHASGTYIKHVCSHFHLGCGRVIKLNFRGEHVLMAIMCSHAYHSAELLA
jgi:ABC-type transport system involved in cytochrome bd biosynthesis fused ATPase/permease subunit